MQCGQMALKMFGLVVLPDAKNDGKNIVKIMHVPWPNKFHGITVEQQWKLSTRYST